jgi:aminopeptidase YwaD
VVYLTGGTHDIDFVINIDGIAAKGQQNSICYFGDAPEYFEKIRVIKGSIVEAEPWYQGDHSIFIQRGIPAVALSCTDPFSLGEVLHSPHDTIDGVDSALIVDVVEFVRELLLD